MKTKSERGRATLASIFAIALSVSSVGCKDTLRAKEQHRVLVEQNEALRAEYASLETKLADLRKVMPPGSTPKAAAEALAKVSQRDIEAVAQEKATVANQIKGQQERLAALQKEIDEFKALKQ